jgi:hypothetical protein
MQHDSGNEKNDLTNIVLFMVMVFVRFNVMPEQQIAVFVQQLA